MNTQMTHTNTYDVLGLHLDNHRHHLFHIIDHNRTWSTDLSRFPGHQHSFAFEDAFSRVVNEVQELTLAYWHTSIYISMVYMVIIFGLQRWMSHRKPFHLRFPLTVWNFALAAFSVMGCYRCLPEFIHIISHDGLASSYTSASYYHDYRLSLWYLLFTLSKALELIDTLFIVLRKSKLITLHWVHHVLTLVFSWYAFIDVPGTARWMVNMNFLVHSLMYAYYGLKAMRVSIPSQVNLTITTLQVVQMFAGLFINFDCLNRKLNGLPVDISYSTALSSFILYAIFTVLFLNFFLRTYILRSSKPAFQKIVCSANHDFTSPREQLSEEQIEKKQH